MLKEVAEASSSNSNMSVFLYVIVTFMVLMFLLRALIGYKKYRTSIFPHLYDNYLIDYFYKLNVFRDASKSALLKKLIGYHRLVYSNISDKEGKLVNQIVTLIHSKGILVIDYVNPHGVVKGGDSGNWFVTRDGKDGKKKYKIPNPITTLREFDTHLRKVTDGKYTQKVVAIGDDCDTHEIHITTPLVTYSQIQDHIKEADCGYGLNDAEIDELFEKLGGKIDRK